MGGDPLWNRQHLERQAQSRPRIHGLFSRPLNASACSGRGRTVSVCECVPARAAACLDMLLRGCVHVSAHHPLCLGQSVPAGHCQRAPVLVHTHVCTRVPVSVSVGGRAACISACTCTWAVPWCDVVLVHLGDTVRVPATAGRGGRARGGCTHVSARYCVCVFGHGLGVTGVGVADGSSWPVTSVAVSRSPAQVGAGISSHLYHGRGGERRAGVMMDGLLLGGRGSSRTQVPSPRPRPL